MLNKFWHRNGSTVLTCVGGVGVIATAVTASKATLKASKILEEARKEKEEELTKWEKTKIVAPRFAVPALIGIATLSAIFGANILNKRHQAGLASAYAMVDQAYKDYKRKNVELHGEEAHSDIMDALAVEKAKDIAINAPTIASNCVLTDEAACGDPVLFYDQYSKRYFESTIEQVITAEYHLNRNFSLRGYTTLNEFYEFLGLEMTDYGEEVGWAVEDEFYWIDFNHRKTCIDEGLECYIIESYWEPTPAFREYYY